jgi:hypothetical protein
LVLDEDLAEIDRFVGSTTFWWRDVDFHDVPDRFEGHLRQPGRQLIYRPVVRLGRLVSVDHGSILS